VALKIALLSWVITIVSLGMFVAVIVPAQKRTFEENLASKARGLSASLQDVIAGAAVTEDYSLIVDHCRQVLQGDDSIVYIVVTQNDGFSLIQESAAPSAAPGIRHEPRWHQAVLDDFWHPAVRKPASRIGVVPLFGRRVFHDSRPFDYSAIQWGWINVGLSVDTYDQSVTTVYRRTGILALACAVVSLLLSLLYARRLVRPIRALEAVLARVSTGDLSARASIHTGDELESLANSVNAMTETLLQRDRVLEQRVLTRTFELREQIAAKEKILADLAEAQHRLTEASRKAGMAEVATGVLHNVGNVLNSVNVSATLIGEQLGASEVSSLVNLGVLLKRHEHDMDAFLTADPRGRRVPGFLIQISEHMAVENRRLQDEQGNLRRNLEHIKEVVNMQQNYATVSGYLEQVQVTELVEDALRLNSSSFLRKGIEVVRHYGDLPPALVDKHKVIHILINLVQNASQAMEDSGRPEKALSVGILRAGPYRFAITVGDNGVGIPPENLVRIFSHGFSTREDGHGFGLHSAALAAREMGGELRVESDGEGRGSTFTLELPLVCQDPEPGAGS
jgi:signal transduction histidine kinase